MCYKLDYCLLLWLNGTETCPCFIKTETNHMKKLTKQAQLTCAKCGETHPRNQFKRRMTAEEYSNALNRRVETGTTVISSLCKQCQPKRKPRAKLTLKELRNKITNKRINPYLGEQLIHQKRKDINDKRKRVMKERWQKEKGKAREALKTTLDKEVRRAGSAYRTLKHRTETCPIKQTRQTKWNTEEERLNLVRERHSHLAVLETQYRLMKERRVEKLNEYDQQHK